MPTKWPQEFTNGCKNAPGTVFGGPDVAQPIERFHVCSINTKSQQSINTKIDSLLAVSSTVGIIGAHAPTGRQTPGGDTDHSDNS